MESIYNSKWSLKSKILLLIRFHSFFINFLKNSSNYCKVNIFFFLCKCNLSIIIFVEVKSMSYFDPSYYVIFYFFAIIVYTNIEHKSSLLKKI